MRNQIIGNAKIMGEENIVKVEILDIKVGSLNNGVEARILEGKLEGHHIFISEESETEYILLERWERMYVHISKVNLSDDMDTIEDCLNAIQELQNDVGFEAHHMNLEKLSREQKEYATNLDYRENRITMDYILRHHEDEAVVEAMLEILEKHKEGKAILASVKKWFK